MSTLYLDTIDTLNALSTKARIIVKDSYLLGGAVGNKDKVGWRNASKLVSGHIYNIYSHRDGVLKYLYQGANAFLSKPIGLSKIEYRGSKIRNIDATKVVDNNMIYTKQYDSILREM
jgi:hypothetical protein